MRKRWALLALVAIVGGCTGGGSSASPPTIDPQTRDQLTVDAGVLQVSDLPGTWDTNREASTASDTLTARDDVLTMADTCFPTTAGLTSTTAREFLSGPTLGHVLVRGVVEAHGDPTQLSTAMKALSAQTIRACVPDVMRRVFGADVQLGEVAIDSSTVTGVGDDGGGALVTVNLSGGGNAFAIGADMVFARVGRFRATCTVINFDSPPDHTLCVAGLKAMVHRLGEQTGG